MTVGDREPTAVAPDSAIDGDAGATTDQGAAVELPAPGLDLSVGRGVVSEMVRLAALEVPGVLRVGRAGPAWRAWLAGPPIAVRIRDERVHVKVWVVARPRADLVHLTAEVRDAVGATIERLLGLQLGSVSVLVDGVGG